MSAVLTASITELCAADHEDDPDKIAAWTRNKSVAGVLVMLDHAERRLFVAERDGIVVAVGAITMDGEVSLNYVHPAARFAGISTALLDRLEQELLALGFDEGRLEATETARRFYERRGWNPDGPRAEGRKVNGYPMRKRFSQ